MLRAVPPAPRADEAAGAATLSGGEQQMLSISRALMSRPKLLLLDEPSLGLAPQVVETIFRILREVNAAGGQHPPRRAERAPRAEPRPLRLRAGDRRGGDAGPGKGAARRPGDPPRLPGRVSLPAHSSTEKATVLDSPSRSRCQTPLTPARVKPRPDLGRRLPVGERESPSAWTEGMDLADSEKTAPTAAQQGRVGARAPVEGCTGAPGERGPQFTLTLMLFGFASARLGTKIRSTPFLCSATALSASRVAGRLKLRANVP